jgi:hypothetical protein
VQIAEDGARHVAGVVCLSVERDVDNAKVRGAKMSGEPIAGYEWSWLSSAHSIPPNPVFPIRHFSRSDDDF